MRQNHVRQLGEVEELVVCVEELAEERFEPVEVNVGGWVEVFEVDVKEFLVGLISADSVVLCVWEEEYIIAATVFAIDVHFFVFVDVEVGGSGGELFFVVLVLSGATR